MKKQIGIISIEALISMLIFSMGILGFIGMQASLHTRNQDARYRMQASALANELMSMALADATNASCYTLPVNNQANCTKVDAKAFTQEWQTEVTTLLPGASANLPQASLNANNDLTISVFWQRPQDTQRHSYLLFTRLGTD